MVDGYDEVPTEYQEKIDFALKNGHIPDEDWKGVSYLMLQAHPSGAPLLINRR
jgi:hypothetical protein